MHVISRKRLKEAAQKHSDLAAPLDAWYRVAKKAKWENLADVRNTWASTDSVERYTVFNIKGNDYRLITEINFQTGRVFIRHVLTHAEYDRGRWKK
jgi:mRNA interferase HigB